MLERIKATFTPGPKMVSNRTRDTESTTARPPHFLKSGDPYFSTTSLGTEICIRRIYSEKQLDPAIPPVVLLHGLGCNGNFFRIPTDGETNIYSLCNNSSFSNHLAINGFDVYIAHLSTARRVFTRLARHYNQSIHSKIEHRVHPTLNFDALVDYEIPEIISKTMAIRKMAHYSSDQLFLIGHSMGSMLTYSYLGKYAHDLRIKGAVAISGPAIFDQSMLMLLVMVEQLYRFFQLGEKYNPVNLVGLNISAIGTVLAYLHDKPATKYLGSYFYNPDNVHGSTIYSYFKKSAEPVSEGFKRQFLEWRKKQRFESADGFIDYLEIMKKISVPMLFVNGKSDHLATPGSVATACSQIQPALLSRLELDRYGHGDIVFGKDAITDVFDPIIQWLRRQSQGLNESQKVIY